MRTARYSAEALVALLRKQKVATLPELMAALGTQVERTVFRRLKELSYRTSYSHRGGYYTLEDIPNFDERGLWTWQSAWFSSHGTLLSTVRVWVEAAEGGTFVDELDNLLHVGTKDALRKLVREGQLARQKLEGQYWYASAVAARRREQLRTRRLQQAEPGIAGPMPPIEVLPEELKAAMVLFFTLLDEKQRRLYAGLESLKTGWGGDRRIGELLGLDVGTVGRGRRELLRRDVEVERIRRVGGGRPPVEKKRPKSSPGSKSC